MSIELPISKSIANRILMLQAIHGDPLMEVSCDMPEDVRLIHDALSRLTMDNAPVPRFTDSPIHLSNCGTAMRFLTAYCAQKEGLEVVLDGCDRLRERPIGQEVEALRKCGAEIAYLGREGYLPLHIVGRKLAVQTVTVPRPLSTQFISALLLIGIPVQTGITSPYVEMTKSLLANYHRFPDSPIPPEKDWSAAAFWYEYIALHGGELELEGLQRNSLQGDQVVAELFRPLGVDTVYTDTGVRLTRTRDVSLWPGVIDFSRCPDLYPAVAITYRQLSKPLIAYGTASLRIKESDRIEAVKNLETRHDHRIAMALLAADLPCDDTECIAKSYPRFVEQLRMCNAQCTIDFTTVVPRKGINDDNLGKKHALKKLIAAAATPYVWLQDDDIVPSLCNSALQRASSPCSTVQLPKADLYILPLRMQGGNSLLERLQVAEYAAIQELTMVTAKRGKAVLCSGANMLVNRQRWLESWNELHPEIPSGDDMFLLESFRRRGLTILPVDRVELTATVYAETSWRKFLHQRMRWAGKAPHYTDSVIRRCGVVVLGANLLQLICPVVLLLKFPIEYSLIKKRDPEVSFGVALLLEIVYPLYSLFCFLGGLLRRSW